MDSSITINIVEPGSSTPIDAGTGTVAVPDTGLFTGGIGSTEATILGIALVLVILATVVTILYYRNKKQGKITKLTQLVSKYKYILAHKKATTIGLTTLAIVVSLGTLAGLLKLGVSAIDPEVDNQSNTQTTQQVDTETSAVAEVTNGEITIELGDTPVFAYIPTTVTVTEDMPAGYTLKAYSANPTLSAEGTDKTITIVPPANSTTGMSELVDNTWGLATEEPTSQTDQIFYSLPETADEAIALTDSDYEETLAGDTYTIYYGIYITPDLPYGTYTGASVNYEIEGNRTDLATVVFDGNGLYFNNNPEQTTNVVRYEKTATDKTVAYSHTPNVNDSGEQDGLYPLDSNKTFVYTFDNAEKVHVDFVKIGADGACAPDFDDYFSFWAGGHPNYTAKDNYAEAVKAFGNTTGQYVFAIYAGQSNLETDISGNVVTIGYTTSDYRNSPCDNPNPGYGYYATITAVDADGNPAHAIGNVLYSGAYKTPATAAVADYEFLGWSMDPNATSANFTDGDDISTYLALSEGERVTLYAIWQKRIEINYNGNGSDSMVNMNNIKQYGYVVDSATTSRQVDLLAPNFSREGYGFVGWSTDAEAWEHLTDDNTTNDPTIYGPNQTITIDKDIIAEAGENRKLILNAIWVPAEEGNGEPVTLQNWQGCSNLTATTYSNGVLTVGRNTITALTDSRDGNVYTVARLADGNCWTVENLRLDNGPELSANNTNNPSLSLINNYAEETTSNHLSANSDEWCFDYGSATCYNQSKLNTNNTALTDTSPEFSQDFVNQAHKDLDANIASYGNYYNWYSATAGNGKYDTGDNVTVAGDICPTGWHLPYGGNQTSTKGGNTSGGFYYLYRQMGAASGSAGSNNWRSFPNNFVYSGYWHGSSAGSRGGEGYYWSSTADNTDRAYNLNFGNNSSNPGIYYGYGKYEGYSARCVAPAE